jgi:hypothetical protein
MDFDVIDELKRRCSILIENTTPDEVATGMDGSIIMFVMALAPAGYPLIPQSWMDENYVKPVMTDEVFTSHLYDDLFLFLFRDAYEKVNKKEIDLKGLM